MANSVDLDQTGSGSTLFASKRNSSVIGLELAIDPPPPPQGEFCTL